MAGAPFPYGATVTRLRGVPSTDRYGATVLDWTTPGTLDIEGCGVNPGGSQEPVEVGRTSVITRPEVYAPVDADVTAADRLVVRGVTYQVDGSPRAWISPLTGWAPGLVIVLKDREG
jgi:hypothetical protein